MTATDIGMTVVPTMSAEKSAFTARLTLNVELASVVITMATARQAVLVTWEELSQGLFQALCFW